MEFGKGDIQVNGLIGLMSRVYGTMMVTREGTQIKQHTKLEYEGRTRLIHITVNQYQSPPAKELSFQHAHIKQ